MNIDIYFDKNKESRKRNNRKGNEGMKKMLFDFDDCEQKRILVIGNDNSRHSELIDMIKTDKCTIMNVYDGYADNELEEYFTKELTDTNNKHEQLIFYVDNVEYLPQNAIFDIIFVFKQDDTNEKQRKNIDFVHDHVNKLNRDTICKYCQNIDDKQVHIFEIDHTNGLNSYCLYPLFY